MAKLGVPKAVESGAAATVPPRHPLTILLACPWVDLTRRPAREAVATAGGDIVAARRRPAIGDWQDGAASALNPDVVPLLTPQACDRVPWIGRDGFSYLGWDLARQHMRHEHLAGVARAIAAIPELAVMPISRLVPHIPAHVLADALLSHMEEEATQRAATHGQLLPGSASPIPPSVRLRRVAAAALAAARAPTQLALRRCTSLDVLHASVSAMRAVDAHGLASVVMMESSDGGLAHGLVHVGVRYGAWARRRCAVVSGAAWDWY